MEIGLKDFKTISDENKWKEDAPNWNDFAIDVLA